MKKILIVNSDLDTMSLLELWLKSKHFDARYTGILEQVPSIISQFAPDLLLIDIMQSELVDVLRTKEETRDLAVLVMTGYNMPEALTRSIEADDFIEKPFKLELLERKINALLRHQAGLAM
jgi:DNA-binding response OmpR family regulator